MFPGMPCVYVDMPLAWPLALTERVPLASPIRPAPSLGQWASLPFRPHTRVEFTLSLAPADDLPATVLSSHATMVTSFQAPYKP